MGVHGLILENSKLKRKGRKRRFWSTEKIMLREWTHRLTKFPSELLDFQAPPLSCNAPRSDILRQFFSLQRLVFRDCRSYYDDQTLCLRGIGQVFNLSSGLSGKSINNQCRFYQTLERQLQNIGIGLYYLARVSRLPLCLDTSASLAGLPACLPASRPLLPLFIFLQHGYHDKYIL